MTILRHILLVAIIATVTLWVFCIWKGIIFAITYCEVWILDGQVHILWDPSGAQATLKMLEGSPFLIVDANPGNWGIWPDIETDSVHIPFWFILTILLPPWWLMGRKSRLRKRWAKEGRCLSCGYNL